MNILKIDVLLFQETSTVYSATYYCSEGSILKDVTLISYTFSFEFAFIGYEILRYQLLLCYAIDPNLLYIFDRFLFSIWD